MVSNGLNINWHAVAAIGQLIAAIGIVASVVYLARQVRHAVRSTKADFLERFGQHFDEVYGKDFKTLRRLGFSNDDGERITLTDRGTYWLHALEDVLSIEYISRLWGTSKQQPWPHGVPLA